MILQDEVSLIFCKNPWKYLIMTPCKEGSSKISELGMIRSKKHFLTLKEETEVKIAIMLLLLELDVFVTEEIRQDKLNSSPSCNSEYHSSSEHA